MKKLMTFEHLDSQKTLEVEFRLDQEGDHWAARLHAVGPGGGEVKAPVFYGTTPEQAERQLRKVFEKEYELRKQQVLAD